MLPKSRLLAISEATGLAEEEPDSGRTVVGNVVFVHGLGGTAIGTWTGINGQLWPGWLATSMQNLGFWTLDWDSPKIHGPFQRLMRLVGRERKWSLNDEALRAMDRLIGRELDKKPLCFVCHSMGGLLVRQILHDGKGAGDANRARLVDATRAVAFFGTPHHGSALADYFSRFPVASDAVRYLRTNHQPLSELARWFEERAEAARPDGLGLKVHTYAEDLRWHVAQVVQRHSADPHAGGAPTPLQSDHFGIIDPDSPRHEIVLGLRRILKDSLLAPSIEQEQRLAELAVAYPFPTAAEIDPSVFGIERSAYVAEADSSSLGPYINRDQEEAILDALRTRRAVRVQGPSSAGKTRTVFEILKSHYGNAQLVVPAAPGDAGELARSLAQTLNPQGGAQADPQESGGSAECTVTHVLWLDDLDRYAAANLHAVEVLRFLARPAHMVVSTIRSSRFEDIRQATGEGTEDARDLLGMLPPVRLSADFSDREARRARASYQGQDFTGGLRSFSAVEELRNRLEDVGLTSSVEGYALVWSVIDWQRMGLRGIEDQQLRRLFQAYLKQVSVGEPTDALYEDAKRWALAPVRRKGEEMSRVSLLRRLVGEDDRFDVHDSLEDFFDSRSDRPIHAAAWEVALETLVDAEGNLATLGYVAAVTRGEPDIGERALRAGMALGQVSATYNLGVLLHEQGRTEEAKAAYSKGVELGSGGAACNLGVLFQERGRTEEAEAAWRKGVKLGYGGAAYNLGLMRQKQGRTEEAEAAYKRGLELGHGLAGNNLGVLLHDQGRTEEAEAAYSKGFEFGHRDAAHNLGVLLEEQGRTEEAEATYSKGVEQGDSDAAYNLGLLLHEQGRTEEAKAALQKGVELGDGLAASSLGVLLDRQGRTEEAEAAFQKGVELGDGVAAFNLGVLLKKQGRTEEAEVAWRKGAELGNRDAAHNLAVLLKEQGRENLAGQDSCDNDDR